MRDINLLNPKVKGLALRLVKECEKQGLKIKITDTLRTKEEQNALYSQGRTVVGKIVTNVKYPQSNHCWGVAFDFCRNDGKNAYENSDKFFEKVGKIGKTLGLYWGGDFKSFKDNPHFEYQKLGTWKELEKKYKIPENFIKTFENNAEKKEFELKNIIKIGDTGEAVKIVQENLKLKVDGIFGTKTQLAVRDFQRKNNLIVDGIVGKKTFNLLNWG